MICAWAEPVAATAIRMAVRIWVFGSIVSLRNVLNGWPKPIRPFFPFIQEKGPVCGQRQWWLCGRQVSSGKPPDRWICRSGEDHCLSDQQHPGS